MTSQQFADELLRHWQLLWPLPAAERIKRIDEIRQDSNSKNSFRSSQPRWPTRSLRNVPSR
jgi:hypothetical protein